MRLLLPAFIFGFSVPPAFAVENPDCADAKDLVNVVKDFYGADAELTNIITPTFTLKLTGLEGYSDPDGMRYIYGQESVDLAISEDGEVLGLEKALSFHKDGKLCKLVNGALVEDADEDTAQASMNFAFPFKTGNGDYPADALVEGAKDGSKVMKSLAPGGLGFVVPGLKAISVRPAEEEGVVPVITFVKDSALIEGPEISSIGNLQLFKIKDLQKSKADSVKITGDYKLEASFNYKPEEIAEAEAKRKAALVSESNAPSQ